MLNCFLIKFYSFDLAFSFNISLAKSVGTKLTPKGAKDTLAILKLPSAFGKQTGIVTINMHAKKFNNPAIKCTIHKTNPKGNQITFDNIFNEDLTAG